MDGSMSIADYLAISDRDDGGVFGGNGFLWVILIFLFFLAFNGNGGIFGNNTTANTAINLDYQTNRDVLETSCATQKAILDSNYQTLLGFKDQQMQMAQCCCDLKSTIITENQTTRDLINQHYVDELGDKLTVARGQINNFEQSQYILSQLGSYYSRPAVNPYTCYNTCGCSSLA